MRVHRKKRVKLIRVFFFISLGLLLLNVIPRIYGSLRLNRGSLSLFWQLRQAPVFSLYDFDFAKGSGVLRRETATPIEMDFLAAKESGLKIRAENGLGTLYYTEGGHLTEAITALERQVKDKQSHLANFKLGFAYEQVKLYNQALQVWQKANAFESGYFLHLGDIALKEEDPASAERYYSVAAEGLPNAQSYIRLAGIAIINGEKERARQLALASLNYADQDEIDDVLSGLVRTVDGRFIWVYINMAMMFNELGEVLNAEYWYRSAMLADNSNLSSFYLARFYCNHDQLKEGIKIFKMVVKRSSQTDYHGLQSRFQLASCYCLAGDLPSALTEASQLVKLDPQDARANRLLKRLEMQGTEQCSSTSNLELKESSL